MRIAFFNKYLPSDHPSGVACQVHWLANEHVRRGHQVVCFSFSPPAQDARYTHVLLRFKTHSPLRRKLEPARQFAAVDVSSFDAVHYHGDDYLCSGSRKRIRTFYGSALFEALHARNPSRLSYQGLFYLFELISCAKQGKLATISRATRRVLPMVKTVIPCGIPLERFTPGGKKSENPSILYLGDLDSRKRGRLLLSIFAQAIRPRFPTAELVIVGPQEVRGPGVRYQGNVDEPSLIAEYRRAWVYCMPSSYEGFGVPLLEAMACATPVVATMSIGAREIISNGVNGILCGPRDLGIQLIEMLESAKRRDALIHAGLQSVQAYSISTVSCRYESLMDLGAKG